MSEFIKKAEARQEIAEFILKDLDLVNRWNQFGKCHIVGAVAYNLVCAPDIDMEVYCPELKIEDGFEIIRACALNPNVVRTRFWNAAGPPHYGLYWRVDYVYEGEEWKVDMWSMEDTYDMACGRDLTEPILQALTPESREIILILKEGVRADAELECTSIQIYRAVLDDKVQSIDVLKEWLVQNPLVGVVTDWKPKITK